MSIVKQVLTRYITLLHRQHIADGIHRRDGLREEQDIALVFSEVRDSSTLVPFYTSSVWLD